MQAKKAEAAGRRRLGSDVVPRVDGGRGADLGEEQRGERTPRRCDRPVAVFGLALLVGAMGCGATAGTPGDAGSPDRKESAANCTREAEGNAPITWAEASPGGPSMGELRDFVAGQWQGDFVWEIPDPSDIVVTGITPGHSQASLEVTVLDPPWRGGVRCPGRFGFDAKITARTSDGGLDWATSASFQNWSVAPSVVSASGVESAAHAGTLRVAKDPSENHRRNQADGGGDKRPPGSPRHRPRGSS